MSDVLFRYEVDQTISIFQNDAEFTSVIITDEGISMTDEKYRAIVELLLANQTYISTYNIDELNSQSPPFLRVEIAAAYEVAYISAAAYKQTLYTFKYSTIKIFFRSNYQNFLPEYDYLSIVSEEKIKIFQEAFMREYDRFASIIDEMYNIVDIDKTPTEYLNYLAQAVGYEREDRVLLRDASFRELIKNIVEIYKIKGTNYSFELFFNFLGFSATIKEFWFDKRFSDPGITSNPETSQADSDFYQYYLTSTKPTRYIPTGMQIPFVITEDLIVPTLDVNLFNKYIDDGTYTAAELLGNTTGFTDQQYTYFKTNVIEYSITPLVSSEDDDEDQLTLEEIVIIQRYATFLTPLFLLKNINILALPIEDSASGLYLSDDDETLTDPVNSALDKDVFFMMYEGLQPSDGVYKDYDPTDAVNSFLWGDDYRYYDDPVPHPTNGIPRSSGTLIDPGGNFIGGYWTDTFSAIYDSADGSGSVYDQLANANLSWTQEDILNYISNLISTDSLFFTFTDPVGPFLEYDTAPRIYGVEVVNEGIGNRDLLIPFKDQGISVEFEQEISLFFDGTPYYFAVSNLEEASYLYAGSDYSDSLEDYDTTNKISITDIDVDNGASGADITIDDAFRRFEDIMAGDTIEIVSSIDRGNNGVYTVDSKSGDVITLTTVLTGSNQSITGGFLRIYHSPWLMSRIQHSFLHELLIVS